MVYLVAATTVTLESIDFGASSVEDSAMDASNCSMHTYSLIYTVSHVGSPSRLGSSIWHGSRK